MTHIGRASQVLRCCKMMEDWHNITASYLGIRTLRFPYQTNFRDSVKFNLEEEGDVEALWQIYFRRIYELRQTDRCIVDAGANIGLFTCFAARFNSGCRVYAVEPFPTSFERLLAHSRINQIEEQVCCFNFALNESGKSVALRYPDKESQKVRIIPNPSEGDIIVPANTLAGLLALVEEPFVDLLKMDIEASEYEVLLSTPYHVLSRIGRLILEYHEPLSGQSHSPHTLKRYLSTCGFRLTHTLGDDRYGLFYFDRS